MSCSLENRIAEFKSNFDLLPEAEEPPLSTLQILGRSRIEDDWQRLLFYFLSPTEPHGLDHSLLEHFLSALSDRDDLDYTFSHFDIDDVQVETEVQTSDGRRPDAVVWAANSWFICWELKVGASEGPDQTRDYVEAEAFESIDLKKDNVPSHNHHYVYLSPSNASLPVEESFVPISWEWMASELRSYLAEGHGKYPAQSTGQINEFANTIERELTMTHYQENQQEKANLYFEYYDEIEEVQNAFQNEWKNFENDWGTRLAQSLNTPETVEISELPDSHVAIELEKPSGERERWIFRQGSSWAGIAKESWRRRTDTEDYPTIYSGREDDNYAHITLYHRLEKNRELAIRDRTLKLKLWHGTSSSETFYKAVNDRLADLLEEREYQLPPNVSLTGRSGSVLTATYDIPKGDYSEFFEAYIEGLNNAFIDLVMDNHELIAMIDRAFEESLSVYD